MHFSKSVRVANSDPPSGNSVRFYTVTAALGKEINWFPLIHAYMLLASATLLFSVAYKKQHNIFLIKEIEKDHFYLLINFA